MGSAPVCNAKIIDSCNKSASRCFSDPCLQCQVANQIVNSLNMCDIQVRNTDRRMDQIGYTFLCHQYNAIR